MSSACRCDEPNVLEPHEERCRTCNLHMDSVSRRRLERAEAEALKDLENWLRESWNP